MPISRVSNSPRVYLRDVLDSDLPIFFEHQHDPEANRMAAFPARDHQAFLAHWTKIRRDPTNIIKSILFEGEVAGNMGSWIAGDQRFIGYWLGREFWGRGIATAALKEFVDQMKTRPLYVLVVKHHLASIRVLEKSGFVVSGTPVVSHDGIEELLFELSE